METHEGYNLEIEQWAKCNFPKNINEYQSDIFSVENISHFCLPYLRYCIYTKYCPHTYLDHAGIPSYPLKLIENCMEIFLQQFYCNPHTSENFTTSIQVIRQNLLQFLGASPDEYSLVFTSGSTQGLSIIAHNFPFSEGSQFAYTLDSHTSVLGIREHALAKGSDLICLPLNNNYKGWMKLLEQKKPTSLKGNREIPPQHLLAISGESNWNGIRPDYNILKEFLVQNRNSKSRWITLLDASRLYSSYELNLSELQFDFVVVSFYKIFGFPTGIGGLLIHHSSSKLLEPTYFGGGTIISASALSDYHIKKLDIISSLESGTPNFQGILCLPIALKHIYGPFTRHQIHEHISSVTRYAYNEMVKLFHSSANPHQALCTIFGHHQNPPYPNSQGPTIAFLIHYSDGTIISPSFVNRIAMSWKIILRVGCHCNLGACQNYLLLTDQDIKSYNSQGFRCGGQTDMIDGQPLGCLRISFGSNTTINDINRFISFLRVNFSNITNPKNQANKSKTIIDIGKRILLPPESIIYIYNNSNIINSNINNEFTIKEIANFINPENNGKSPTEEEDSLATSETTLETRLHSSYNSEHHNDSNVSDTNWSFLNRQITSHSPKITSDLILGLIDQENNIGTSFDNLTSLSYIKQILIYPIKGCRGLSVKRWPVLSNGLLWDRQFAIYRNNKPLITSSHPELVLLGYRLLIPIITSFSERVTHVKLNPYVLPVIRFFTPDRLEYRNITLSTYEEWTDICESPEFSLSLINAHSFPKNLKINEVSLDGSINFQTPTNFDIFSSIKSATVQNFDENYNYPSVQLFESTTPQLERSTTHFIISGLECELIYSEAKHYNTRPFLLLNQESLGLLSKKLEIPMEIERFRPNFVISGLKPFEEYNYLRFRIGDISFICQGECIRCKSINVDYKTGFVNNSILRGLATYYRSLDQKNTTSKPKMGVLLNLESSISFNNGVKSDNKIDRTISINKCVYLSEPHNPHIESTDI